MHEKALDFGALGWLYLVPLLLFLLAQGRRSGAGLFDTDAAGAVWIEGRLVSFSRGVSRTVIVSIAIALVLNVLIAAAVVLPIAPINSKWWAFAVKNNGDLVEEIGWPEFVEIIAQVRDQLPANELEHLGILAGNYGEAGALSLYGPQYSLPWPICGTNSFWGRGYGNPPPETLIVVGFSREFIEDHFSSFEVVAQSRNRYGVANEETKDHPDIYLCRGFRGNWSEFWKTFQRYG